MATQRFVYPIFSYLPCETHHKNQLVGISLSTTRAEVKVGDSRHGPPQHTLSEVMRLGAIRNAPAASIEDLVCIWSTKTFRTWSSGTISFKRQLPLLRDVRTNTTGLECVRSG